MRRMLIFNGIQLFRVMNVPNSPDSQVLFEVMSAVIFLAGQKISVCMLHTHCNPQTD